YGAPGTAPGTLAPPPDAAPHVLVTAVHYTEEDYTETQVTDLQAYLQTAPQHGVFWFNVDGLGDIQVLETLGAHFHLHPLSLEDVLHIPQRAKIEDYEHYQFLVFHMPLLDPVATGETEQVTLFLGHSFVLTFQERPGSDLFESVRLRLRQARGKLRQSGADYLAYALLDTAIDGFFPLLADRPGFFSHPIRKRPPALCGGANAAGNSCNGHESFCHLRPEGPEFPAHRVSQAQRFAGVHDVPHHTLRHTTGPRQTAPSAHRARASAAGATTGPTSHCGSRTSAVCLGPARPPGPGERRTLAPPPASVGPHRWPPVAPALWLSPARG